MTTRTMSDRCDQEDEAGRMCSLGPGHTTPHLMGKSYKPSPAQVELLREIERFPVRQFQNIGSTTVASLKALFVRRFIRLRYINSRSWDAALTPAGRRLLQDLPR